MTSWPVRQCVASSRRKRKTAEATPHTRPTREPSTSHCPRARARLSRLISRRLPSFQGQQGPRYHEDDPEAEPPVHGLLQQEHGEHHRQREAELVEGCHPGGG